MDLSNAFEYGQGYVALSRVRTLKGLTLSGINERALEVHPEIKERDEEFRAASEAARTKFLVLKEEEIMKHTLNLLLNVVKDAEFKHEFVETLKFAFSQPEVTEVIVELFRNALGD